MIHCSTTRNLRPSPAPRSDLAPLSTSFIWSEACRSLTPQPGGYLILSTISRTPLSQLLTLTLAENVLRLVSPGTHTYSKFVKPSELRKFAYAEMGGYDTWERNEDASDVRADEVGSTRGIVYDPLSGTWKLWRGAEGTWTKSAGEGCNYMWSAKKRFDATA